MAVTPELEAVRARLLGEDAVPVRGAEDVPAARAAMAADVAPVDEGVSVERLEVGGRPAVRLRPPGSTALTVLYLHGGGYVCGNVESRLQLCGRLATRLPADVVAVGYRQAPEDPFPAAVEDAVEAARWLAATGTRWVLAGDSAGGGLAAATLVALRDAGDPLPDAAVLLAPWTDLAVPVLAPGVARLSAGDPDGSARRRELQALAALYLAGGTADDPRASPVHADLHGLPPVFVQLGSDDVLIDDSLRLHAALRAAGVDALLEVWDDMPHVFQRFATLPEAADAIERIAAFVARVAPAQPIFTDP